MYGCFLIGKYLNLSECSQKWAGKIAQRWHFSFHSEETDNTSHQSKRVAFHFSRLNDCTNHTWPWTDCAVRPSVNPHPVLLERGAAQSLPLSLFAYRITKVQLPRMETRRSALSPGQGKHSRLGWESSEAAQSGAGGGWRLGGEWVNSWVLCNQALYICVSPYCNSALPTHTLHVSISRHTCACSYWVFLVVSFFLQMDWTK